MSAVFTPIPAVARQGRITELDGLRGIGILLVLFSHFAPTQGALAGLLPIFHSVWFAVDLLFILSGYLITGILLDEAGQPHYYRNYFVRRSLRILPLYYACLGFYAVVTYYPHAPNVGEYLRLGAWWYVGYAGNFLNFIQNHFPGWSLLTPLWSMQVEEQFYITYPFVAASVRRETLRKILLGAVAGAFLIRCALVLLMPGNTLGTYTLAPCRMDAVSLGCLIQVAQRDNAAWLRSRLVGWVTLACALATVAICLTAGGDPWSNTMRTIGYSVADVALAGVLVILLFHRPPGFVKLCQNRVLMKLGVMSYGIYLLHIPVSQIAKGLAPAFMHSQSGGLAGSCLSVGAAIAAAWLSWTLFESPILRLKRHFRS